MQRAEIYSAQFLKINTVAGSSGQTALILAAEKGKWDVVGILVKHGADVNVKGEKYVCQFSNINTITGSSGETALIVAAEEGNLDIVNMLVEAGADVNAKFGGDIFSTDFPNIEVTFSGPADETALTLAAERGMWDIVNILLQHGASTGRSPAQPRFSLS